MTDINKQNVLSVMDYNSGIKPTWCTGCGNFAIFAALKQALVELDTKPTEVTLVFDIGCNGNGADKIKAYGFKGLHGRALPVAAGIKLANEKMKVIALGGDGGTLDEGMHHFVHSFRNNYDITFIMHNNCNFGLTTGQETPTTPKGNIMPVSPWGVVADRLNPMKLAMTAGATFIASGWSGDQKQMKELMKEAINHEGMGFVHIYQHCPTYNDFEDVNFIKDRVYDVGQKEGYDSSNWIQAFSECEFFDDKRATGIIYKNPGSVPFHKRLGYRDSYNTSLVEEVQKYDVSKTLAKFR